MNQTTRSIATASPDFMLGEAWAAQAFDSSLGLFYMTYRDEEMGQICSLLGVEYGVKGAGLWTAVNRNGIVDVEFSAPRLQRQMGFTQPKSHCYSWMEVVPGLREEMIASAFEYLVPNRLMTPLHLYG